MRRRLEARFFVLRTPALPADDWQAWGRGLAAPDVEADAAGAALEAALAADRQVLRSRLAQILARPQVEEAIALATPSLHRSLATWRGDPDGRKGRRAEQALVRYFARMSGRPTPFGLFSGSSFARLDAAASATSRSGSVLRLEGRDAERRHSRLDMDFLVALAEVLTRDEALWPWLTWRPNTSLHRVGDRWRYVETRSAAVGRSHHLVAVDASDYLDDLLAFATPGVAGAALVERLVAGGEGEIEPAEAAGFVAELVQADVLTGDLEPALSGDDPTLQMVRRLRAVAAAAPADSAAAGLAAAVADRLERARRTLRELDAAAADEHTAERTAVYRDLAAGLEDLPVAPQPGCLVQVDLFKPLAAAHLDAALLDELAVGVDLLHRLTPRFPDTSLDRFRDAFLERWGEGCEVPLLVALDEEIGLGFGGSAQRGDAGSSLLDALPFPAPALTQRWGPREVALLEFSAGAEPGGAVELTDDWLQRLAEPDPAPPPDALHALITLAAAGEEALAAGDVRILLRHASGPSGVRLLGRFCYADPALADAVAEHLRGEEALRPDAVFAEVAHLPQGRMGNVIHRLHFGRREVPFLGRSGAAPDDLLPVDDLRVTVHGGRVELRSARLRRRVEPALTTAHDYDHHGLAVYRFLGSLMGAGSARGMAWLWGPLEAAPWTPRVTRGRLVLERARWRLSGGEVAELAGLAGAERLRRVRRWRRRLRVPRQVVFVELDNELPVDLENVLSLDAFLAAASGHPEAVLYEAFPSADELCVSSPEGRFAHELLVPLLRRGAPRREAPPPPSAAQADCFPPGSEWLYAKLYCRSATADRLLAEVVAPLAAAARAGGAADRWFFLRYADPEPHLRVRFHGEPRRLHGEVLPALEAAVVPWIGDGRVAALQIDTYRRETERYGGADAIVAAEDLFAADSEAAARVVTLLPGEAGADLRWRLALAGADRLLADLGFDLAQRHELVQAWREAGQGGTGSDGGAGEAAKALRLALDRRFRDERPALEALLAAVAGEADAVNEPGPPGGMPPAALDVLLQRSLRSAAGAGDLSRLAACGCLHRPLADVAASLVHMQVNRWIRDAPVRHEAVIYDFLARLYASRLARARAAQPVG